MVSTLDTGEHDPHDVLEISPDVVLVARAAADFPSLAPEVKGHHDREPSMGSADAAVPKVDATFRASDTSGERSVHGKWLRSAAMAFVFALCSALAAAGWERYGDEARATLANYTPQVALSSLLPTSLITGRAAVATPADAPAAPAAATDQVSQPPPAPQQAADSSAAPAAAAAPAALPPETVQMLQSMARDVASLNQQLSELKASIAELKAGQDQLSHEMVAREPKVSAARPVEPRPTKLGAPPRPLGTLVTHRPKPPSYYPPAQAAYAPPPPSMAAPVQIAPAPRPDPDTVVVRPPMPVQ
ncbi:MAG TPA: hypothetical protein VKR55_01520 [Bradyrhizobium sp.]|uniref:hypothetical protein n=1 Tax=Bradyrhizobium sp. TaxID=376 RepID=UPI002BABC88C|nr:hypothetical protein [Bradyrhizobium sp.]HLZ00810.1 hypothetical protein [Bradyrhizobium sp.]